MKVRKQRMSKIIAIIVTILIMVSLGTMTVYALTAGYEPSSEIIEENPIQLATVLFTYDGIVVIELEEGEIYSFYGEGFDETEYCLVTLENGQVTDAWF